MSPSSVDMTKMRIARLAHGEFAQWRTPRVNFMTKKAEIRAA